MERYRVDYEFRYCDLDVSDGKFHKDFLDNNGVGFSFEDAERVACELRASTVADVKWAEIVKIKED